MAADASLFKKTATEILVLLKSEAVSPLDLLDTLEARIAEVDGAVNALPTLCFERARDNAKTTMTKPVGERGMLAGMPVAIKDLDPVAGVRSTWGSPIYQDFVPERSDCLVETLEANEAIVYAKSNTPEFGAGANTFNEVFGATVNPWDTSKSCAGSSGGSAVALATEIAECSPLGVVACRKIMREGFADRVREATDRELIEQGILRETVDFKEGTKAMTERRVASFIGR